MNARLPRCLAVALSALTFALAAPAASRAAATDSVAAAPRAAAAPSIAPPRLGGYVQAREIAEERTGLTMVLNRVRFSIAGALPSDFSYRLLTELEASAGARSPATVSLREAVVQWKPVPFTLTAGEFKTPFTREYLVPVPELELADLAVAVDSLAPRYDVGFMAEVALPGRTTVSAGVFNGDGANATANRDSAVLLVGRVATSPLAGLDLGASLARDGDDSLRWGVDAAAAYRVASVRAEYVTRHRRGRATGEDDFGWYVFEAFRVSPRTRLLARQEDFRRPAYGDSRRSRGLAWGADYDVVPGRVRLLAEFSRRMRGASQARRDAFLAQVQARF